MLEGEKKHKREKQERKKNCTCYHVYILYIQLHLTASCRGNDLLKSFSHKKWHFDEDPVVLMMSKGKKKEKEHCTLI